MGSQTLKGDPTGKGTQPLVIYTTQAWSLGWGGGGLRSKVEQRRPLVKLQISSKSLLFIHGHLIQGFGKCLLP